MTAVWHEPLRPPDMGIYTKGAGFYCADGLLPERAAARSSSARSFSSQDETCDAAVLIIAQRISTILHADQIVVLKDGEVVGQGRHEELMETCEEYRKTVELQRIEDEKKKEGNENA